MFEARDMQRKTTVLWLAGLLTVLVVACAGVWSLAVATAYAYADEAIKTEAPQPTDKAAAADDTTVAPAAGTTTTAAATAAKAADTAADGAKAQPADEMPGVYQLPLRAKASRAADPAAIAPATFAIAGKKFLDGRALEAGEFTFHMAKLGAYTVPLGSKLPSQLRSAALSDAEKYELVAYGGLHYLNSAVQPLPDPDTATNAADGTVSFAPITINASMLGETATRRTTGVIFAYCFSEEPPRNADGTLVDGVTKDSLGRYVYQGVTYDDTLKRAYLYAYQDYDADKNPVVKVIALGDATFDAAPVRDQAGLGVGFRNTYNGTVVDDYDGTVHLEGRPISAGEFNFDVHEVTESGTLVDNDQVACEECAGGHLGAEVPVFDGQQFHQAGRYYFTVSQAAAGATAPANVQLDKTAYVVTVDATADAQNKLTANIAAVRKMEEGSDEWVDVDTTGQSSPLVWQNKLVVDEPAAPDDSTVAPTAPSDPESPSQPEASQTPENDQTFEEGRDPSVDSTPNGEHASVAGTVVSGGEDEASAATGDSEAAIETTQVHQAGKTQDADPVTRFLAQTDDSLTGVLLILLALSLGSTCVLLALRERRA